MNLPCLCPAALLLLLTSACVRSELSPDALVSLTGRVERPGGTGDPSVEVVLSRSGGNLCTGTLTPFATATTDADGRYAFELRGADTQAGDLARCFRVAPAPAADGSTGWAELLLQVTQPVVPPLPRWAWNLSAEPGAGGDERFTFEDLRAAQGAGTARLQLSDGTGQLAWEVREPVPGTALDAALLEDFTGLRARLAWDRVLDGQKTSVDLSFQSAEVTVPRGGRLPVSRGAACSFGGAAVCPLTDGALGRAAATADNLGVTLQLPGLVVPGDLVLRGVETASGAARLEVTGVTPAGAVLPLGGLSAEEPLGAFERTPLASGGQPVVSVTVRWIDRSGAAVPVTGLSEVSVFGTP